MVELDRYHHRDWPQMTSQFHQVGSALGQVFGFFVHVWGNSINFRGEAYQLNNLLHIVCRISVVNSEAFDRL